MEERTAGVDDRVELRALVEAYAFAVDRRDSEDFIALFNTDATLTVHDTSGAVTGTYVGRTELTELPKRLSRYDQTLHQVHNHDVVIRGEEATGEVYGTAHHVTGEGPDGTDRVLTILYVDRYGREAGHWRFRSREVRLQRSEEREVQR